MRFEKSAVSFDPSTPFSILMWVRLGPTGGQRILFQHHSRGLGVTFVFGLAGAPYNNTVFVDYWRNDMPLERAERVRLAAENLDGLIAPNRIWTHVAAVYTGEELRLFINGELQYRKACELRGPQNPADWKDQVGGPSPSNPKWWGPPYAATQAPQMEPSVGDVHIDQLQLFNLALYDGEVMSGATSTYDPQGQAMASRGHRVTIEDGEVLIPVGFAEPRPRFRMSQIGRGQYQPPAQGGEWSMPSRAKTQKILIANRNLWLKVCWGARKMNGMMLASAGEIEIRRPPRMTYGASTITSVLEEQVSPLVIAFTVGDMLFDANSPQVIRILTTNDRHLKLYTSEIDERYGLGQLKNDPLHDSFEERSQ
jgi:hypothetical protein